MFREDHFSFFSFLYDNLPLVKTTRQILMKLTKKEALVEAPDFLFSFVPAQPFKIRGGGGG